MGYQGKCYQQQFGPLLPAGILRLKMSRIVRQPVLPVGELRGVIYRAKQFPIDEPKNYIHFFKERHPLLATNTAGTQLYIVGGHYRVTNQGIQG